MNRKSLFLRGTLVLTMAGLLSRLMGFFYRIFLANTIGAEGMGIYQLIFPVYSVCFSLCASGIETAVSKLTAEKLSAKKETEVAEVLRTGILLTLTLSLCCTFLIYHHADFLANVFLKESRCAGLLKILAITIPFGTTQSCICGYYLGRLKPAVPSAAQLIEQTLRIASVFFLCHLYTESGMDISPAIAVIGLMIGEACSLLFTITCLSARPKTALPFSFQGSLRAFKEITVFAGPLTLSRISINLLASLEATLIPNALKAYGLSSADALSIYGILTGMALPFILFPNALTGSISMMLLPTVSESSAEGDQHALRETVHKTLSFCLFLGFGALIFFFLFGDFLGEFIFSSTLAGTFIKILAWICPFLYTNTTLTSILNGLGKTSLTFFNGIAGLFLRIAFIFLIVPQMGIYGYLLGLLCSQLAVTFTSCFSICRIISPKRRKTHVT